MSELIFNHVEHKEYNSFSLYIESGILELDINDFTLLKIEKTKYEFYKATIRINKQEVKDKIKEMEKQINYYLKESVGVGPITILYGNRIYTKTLLRKAITKKNNNLNFKSIWINKENKPSLQLWYESN